MTFLLRRWLPKPKPIEAVLLPSSRFFILRVELDAAAEARPQVELALESASPFPSAQMLLGFVHGADGHSALAYAAHKRRFANEETAAWPASSPVVPEFLALLGHRPAGDGVVLAIGEGQATALAWKSGESLPAAACSLATEDGTPAEAAREAARRAGIAADAPVTQVEGAPAGLLGDDGLELAAGDGPSFRVAPRFLDDADVREAAFLARRRRQAAWERRAWTSVQACAAVLLLAAATDVGAAVLRWRTARSTEQAATQQARVHELEALQSVATKLGELGDNRPLPFEMLALANAHRPSSLTFQSISCKAAGVLEIEARTTSPEDVGGFDQALRGESALVAKTETRDLRARDGNTTFTLVITFKPDALRKAATSE